jgi:hypothetical protein
MRIDLVSGPAADFADDRLKAGVLHLDRPTAGTADDVVVVLLRLARDIGMLAGWQVESFQSAEFREEFERPEDRRPSDLHTSFGGLIEQLGRREVSGPAVDELGHSAARPGDSVAGACELDIQRHRGR